MLAELLLGGTIEVLCAVQEPFEEVEIQVDFTPASGEHARRECRLAQTFVGEFLDQQSRPLPGKYEPFPPRTRSFDLACASGHLPTENSLVDSDGRSRAAGSPKTL